MSGFHNWVNAASSLPGQVPFLRPSSSKATRSTVRVLGVKQRERERSSSSERQSDLIQEKWIRGKCGNNGADNSDKNDYNNDNNYNNNSPTSKISKNRDPERRIDGARAPAQLRSDILPIRATARLGASTSSHLISSRQSIPFEWTQKQFIKKILIWQRTIENSFNVWNYCCDSYFTHGCFTHLLK